MMENSTPKNWLYGISTVYLWLCFGWGILFQMAISMDFWVINKGNKAYFTFASEYLNKNGDQILTTVSCGLILLVCSSLLLLLAVLARKLLSKFGKPVETGDSINSRLTVRQILLGSACIGATIISSIVIDSTVSYPYMPPPKMFQFSAVGYALILDAIILCAIRNINRTATPITTSRLGRFMIQFTWGCFFYMIIAQTISRFYTWAHMIQRSNQLSYIVMMAKFALVSLELLLTVLGLVVMLVWLIARSFGKSICDKQQIWRLLVSIICLSIPLAVSVLWFEIYQPLSETAVRSACLATYGLLNIVLFIAVTNVNRRAEGIS